MTSAADRTVDPGAPRFEYDLLLCPDFEAVLGETGRPIAVVDAVQVTLDRGRVLLQARGGAGKTQTLRRLADAGRSQGVHVSEVWAVSWAHVAAAKGAPIDVSTLMAALSSATTPPRSPSSFADQRESLLLVDGLNEVQVAYVYEILATVDLLAARYPQLGIVVADRLARRPVDPSSWQLATLTPVPEWQVREVLGTEYDADDIALFGNPFFLERARRNPLTAATHRSFFLAQLGLDEAALRRLARAVNTEYSRHKDRLMNTASLEEAVGAETISQLFEAGVLQLADGRLRFVHHLVSDFLAALDLADEPQRWTGQEFDTLTFTASSFDALPMLLDEINPADADRLIRRVHDWNFYAAAYLVAEDDVRSQRVSADMTTALLAMLAERRFDPIQATAQQVSDALRVQRSRLAERLLSASDRQEVQQVVQGVTGEADWFDEWRRLFLRTDGEVDSDDILLLRETDGLLGWTAANIFKRLTFAPEAIEDALVLLHHENATVRWRSAHTLGAVPENGDVVIALLDSIRYDVDLWVRYGALRSLIEIAAKSEPQTRRRIFIELGELSESLLEAPQLAREVARGLRVAPAPAGWAEDAGLLLEQLWANSGSIADQDLWREVSASLRLNEEVAALD